MDLRFVGVVLICRIAAIAHAHHAAAGLYDRSTLVAVSGKIESVFWRNPHVHLSIAVDGDVWDVETGSVNTLERMGVTENRFTVGDGSTCRVTRGAAVEKSCSRKS